MGGNPFAFDSYCNDETDQGAIQIFKRQSNGNLIFYGGRQPMPAAAPGSAFCAGPVAADSSNHLAAAVFRIDSQPHDAGFIVAPPSSPATPRIRTATSPPPAMSTTCRHSPVAGNTGANAISISPDNKYVAVGVAATDFRFFTSTAAIHPRLYRRAPYRAITSQNSAGTRRTTFMCSPPCLPARPTTYLSVFTVTSSGGRRLWIAALHREPDQSHRSRPAIQLIPMPKGWHRETDVRSQGLARGSHVRALL